MAFSGVGGMDFFPERYVLSAKEFASSSIAKTEQGRLLVDFATKRLTIVRKQEPSPKGLLGRLKAFTSKISGTNVDLEIMQAQLIAIMHSKIQEAPLITDRALESYESEIKSIKNLLANMGQLHAAINTHNAGLLTSAAAIARDSTHSDALKQRLRDLEPHYTAAIEREFEGTVRSVQTRRITKGYIEGVYNPLREKIEQLDPANPARERLLKGSFREYQQLVSKLYFIGVYGRIQSQSIPIPLAVKLMCSKAGVSEDRLKEIEVQTRKTMLEILDGRSESIDWAVQMDPADLANLLQKWLLESISKHLPELNLNLFDCLCNLEQALSEHYSSGLRELKELLAFEGKTYSMAFMPKHDIEEQLEAALQWLDESGFDIEAGMLPPKIFEMFVEEKGLDKDHYLLLALEQHIEFTEAQGLARQKRRDVLSEDIQRTLDKPTVSFNQAQFGLHEVFDEGICLGLTIDILMQLQRIPYRDAYSLRGMFAAEFREEDTDKSGARLLQLLVKEQEMTEEMMQELRQERLKDLGGALT